jgi:hypothetical protein
MEPRMMISVTDVLKAISDKKSFELFRIVALTKPDADILVSKTKLTRKQYYSRMSSLISAGLIKRKNGKHTLTAFGKVIYDICLVSVENAVNNYWKLKAVDSLQISNNLPAEEYEKLVNSLIDDSKIIKVILDPRNRSGYQSYAYARQQQNELRQIEPELLIHTKEPRYSNSETK